MAKLCKECDRAVEENDILCPHCGAVLLEKTSSNSKLDSNVNTLLDSMLNSDSQARQTAPPSQPVETKPQGFVVADAQAPDDTDAVVMLGMAETSDVPPAVQSETGNVPNPAARPERRSALESSFSDAPRESHGNKTSKVMVVVVVLAILALFAAIVMLIILPMQQQNRQKAEIVSYLEGAWISDEFAFADSTAKNYVEVLTVDMDGNFKMLYTVPDEAYPDGWNTGMWKIEKEISGHINYVEDEQRLLLLYEEDGENYFFDRTFVAKEEDTMRLREYYDESKSTFYDVDLYRINMP